MINSIAQSKMKYLHLLSLVFIVIIVSGCTTVPFIATDLLSHAQKNNQPLINNAVTIDVEINSSINNHQNIDESVKKSLEIALINANIFNTNSSQNYRIMANIKEASQSRFSFGSFPGTLKIDYILLDETSNVILNEMILTVAESDKWYMDGTERHKRSRAVNMSKNVLEFVDILQKKFEQ